ncbi:MAG: hypothetical protein M3P98_03915 [bacterium]|nr:hypothetical protein [bacterium]
MIKKLNQNGVSALIIVIIVAVFTVISGVGYMLYSRNADETLTIKDITDESLVKFSPPYRLELTITNKDGKVSNITVQAQDETTQRAVITSPEGSIETITTADAIYSKFGEKFTKIARTDADSGNPADDFVLDQNDIDRVTNNGEVIGTADCRGMKCTEIKFIDERGDEWRIFVENSTKKLIRSTGDTQDGIVVLEFYYEDVSITIPSDDEVQDLSETSDIGNLNLKDFNL